MKRALRLLAAAALALGAGVLAWAMLGLPVPALRLAAVAGAHIGDSGVSHPVTAVLLNFRGYDTLLEVAVLQLAMVGVLSAGRADLGLGQRVAAEPQPLLQSMARALAPPMLLVAGYLLWAGAHQPGGAFQASAVLAAMAVLLYLSGLMPAWKEPRLALRCALAGGLLLFLAIAAAGHALLAYPPPLAGALIMTIETALALSLAPLLAGLFLWLPDEHEQAEE